MEPTACVRLQGSTGPPADRASHREPVVIALGATGPKFLGAPAHPAIASAPGSRIVLTDGVAPPIDHVRGDAPRHRRFINGSRFMSRRLELLPRVGTKTMQAIGDEPRSRPFENFADLEERVRLNPPEKLVVECIEQEPTRVEETHRTFVTE